MARFYLDSDIGKLAAELLRELGHDVEYAIDSGLGAEPDPFHLRRAASSRRVLVTMNAQDFRSLHRLWKTLVHWQLLPGGHYGVLTSSRRISERELVRAVELLLRSGSDFAGRLLTWQAETGVWHEDKF